MTEEHSQDAIRSLEVAALNAWPALEEIPYDGWALRFAAGYTKRANSVNPLLPGALPAADKIAACEALYRARGLPPIFRLTPLAWPADLDALLAARGYTVLDPTAVMTVGLDRHPSTEHETDLWRSTSLDGWFPHYVALAGVGTSPEAVARQQIHRRIVEAIASPRLFALVEDKGEVAACGLGVLESGLFGLFDIITAPALRRRGFGRSLVAGMLAWAQAQGVVCAYLQVMLNNKAARALYEGQGFAEIYRYWYRIPPYL